MNAELYTYNVRYSQEDGEFLGTVAEFPSLSWLADTLTGALQGIQQVVADVLADMAQTGESAPIPFGQKEYSGKFVVRVPPAVHRDLAIAAAQQGVSLNRHVAARLQSA